MHRYAISSICVTGWLLVACSSSPAKVDRATRVLPFYNTADFTPVWINQEDAAYKNIHTIPPFRFINQLGDTVTEKTFSGKIYVTDFFFTSCPGICKRLTSNLTIVQDSFKNDPAVLLLSHSVTPASDTVPRLRQYANAFGVIAGKWHLVTGSQDAVYTIARQSYFADEDMGLKKNSRDFLHTENIILIDKNRRIRGVYKGTSVNAVNELISDIKILEKEQ